MAAAIILLAAFGSLTAAALPLIVAGTGVGVTMALVGVLANVMDVPEWAPAVAALIGLGVGIDYALLVVSRHRAALAEGLDRRAAVVQAVATAGRSVLVAGGTVVVSLLGLFLMGISFLRGVAVAASLGVLVVMIGSVTLLPALLAFTRDRRPAPRPSESRRAERWSRAVQRRPWLVASLTSAFLLALAIPALALRLGFPDAGNDRAGTTSRAAYELVSRAFGPGANGPLLVVVTSPPERVDALAARLRREPGVASAGRAQPSRDGEAALVTVIPDGSPQAPETQALVHRLREHVLPAAASVGGSTASLVDQGEIVGDRLPLFIGGVIALAFVLLLIAFRSPVIAAKAAVMNLLSIGAAYGVVSLVAGGGWAGSLIGIDTETPVPPFIPVMMFAILFGVSMDYEVFLLSRVREEYLRHGDTSRAVAGGLARTARVITAAAAIMVAVFASFALASEVVVKLLGVGLATAVLIDATLVRLLLVPATMQLLGSRNWWLPDWLDRRLPRVEV